MEEFTLPANRDNADFVRQIPAGEEREIIVFGDFIYCKEASRDVDVIVNGKTTRMQSGDVRKIGTPYRGFNVKNLDSENPVYVEFVAGFGEFDRKIVEGVIGSEEVLRNSTGGVQSDTRQTAEFIFTSTNRDQTPYSQGELVAEYKTGVGYINESESQNKIIDGPNDELWFFNRNDEGGENAAYRIYRMTKEGEVIDSSMTAPYSIDGAGTVGDFAYSEKYGLLALINSPGEYGWVYTVGGSFDKLLELPINPDFETVYNFCFIRESVIAYERRDGEVIAYDIEQKAILRSYNIGSITTYDSVRYDAATDTIWMTYGPGDLIVVDAETFELVSEQDGTKTWPVFPNGKTQWVVKANFVYMAKDGQDPLIIQKFAGVDFISLPTFGAFAQDQELVYSLERRREVYSGAAVTVGAISDGAVVSGEVIRCALEAFYGRRMPVDYLDHVYYFAASKGATGQPIKSQGGGNRSLALLGETDTGAVLAPCRITVTHDSYLQMGGYL